MVECLCIHIFFVVVVHVFVQLFYVCGTVCKDNIAVVGELFLTLGSLAVRNDFCEEIMNLGGIKLIVDTFERNMADKVIMAVVLCCW